MKRQGDKMKKRYRIQFIARFEQIITAESLAHAKQIAEDLQTGSGIDAITDAHCAWNIIEPLDTDGD